VIRPFTPDEALACKAELIPPFVIEAVNGLLAKQFDGQDCTIYQNEVISLAIMIGTARGDLPRGTSKQTFFDEQWLNFEPMFRKSGWNVSYDKPAWCESYEPFWRFSRNDSR
jgi:hypothetical protein